MLALLFVSLALGEQSLVLTCSTATTCPVGAWCMAGERGSSSWGYSTFPSPSPRPQGPHGEAAQPPGAVVEAAPGHWVLVAPVALQDSSRGAVVALEAGVGRYRGGSFPRGFPCTWRAPNTLWDEGGGHCWD